MTVSVELADRVRRRASGACEYCGATDAAAAGRLTIDHYQPHSRGGSTAMSTDAIRVYVPLLNEGTDVLRPTTGVFVSPNVVRIEAVDDYDPEAEEWEFPPGSEVRCVAEFRGGSHIIVARERVIESAPGPRVGP